MTTRRSFVKAAAAASVAAPFVVRSSLFAQGGGDKLNCAVIGCGGRGGSHIGTAAGQNLIALVDVDEKKLEGAKKNAAGKGVDADKIQTFTDYRPLFDKLGKELDAIFIATPNHQHALPSLIALQLGIGVYCEKPLCHTVGEARQLAAAAAKYKVASQMGNQGHCEEGYRRLCEYLWAGALGQIKETHSWSDRANGGIGPRPASSSPPAGMNWDAWIGPAPYREYHADLHPHEWHGWYDFGNGSLGNMGCHVLDGVFWALKLGHPTRIEAEEIYGGSEERLPTGTRIRWDFPARGDLAAVKVYWYDGRIGAGDTGDGNRASPKGTRGERNLPSLLKELQKEYPDEKFDSNGTLYVGEKGIAYTGTYGGGMKLLPKKLMDETPSPEKSLPRNGSVSGEFLKAVREKTAATTAGFDYSARLTEFTLLGNLAQRAGAGKPVEWDGEKMKVTNLESLNAWVQVQNREGWRA